METGHSGGAEDTEYTVEFGDSGDAGDTEDTGNIGVNDEHTGNAGRLRTLGILEKMTQRMLRKLRMPETLRMLGLLRRLRTLGMLERIRTLQEMLDPHSFFFFWQTGKTHIPE